ncbi:MAG: nucleotidyltransferase family protein [Paracoccaceae bacterium]|nr:nucleotidyltransferase family protein [Paracoccaceae bacterium]
MIPDAAMIFAAGFGTRMGTLTKSTPKPMLKLGDRPMIDHTLDILRDAGVGRIIANTHYLPELIEPHLQEKGVTVLREVEILETGGGLRAALPVLNCNPVLTINPDAFWRGPNPIKVVADAWHDSMSALLLCVPSSIDNSDFSLEQGELRRKGPYRYAGVQILRTDRLHEIDQEVFSLNAYWDLLADTGPIHGALYPGEWLDIGTAEKLEMANARFVG